VRAHRPAEVVRRAWPWMAVAALAWACEPVPVARPAPPLAVPDTDAVVTAADADNAAAGQAVDVVDTWGCEVCPDIPAEVDVTQTAPKTDFGCFENTLYTINGESFDFADAYKIGAQGGRLCANRIGGAGYLYEPKLPVCPAPAPGDFFNPTRKEDHSIVFTIPCDAPTDVTVDVEISHCVAKVCCTENKLADTQDPYGWNHVTVEGTAGAQVRLITSWGQTKAGPYGIGAGPVKTVCGAFHYKGQGFRFQFTWPKGTPVARWARLRLRAEGAIADALGKLFKTTAAGDLLDLTVQVTPTAAP